MKRITYTIALAIWLSAQFTGVAQETTTDNETPPQVQKMIDKLQNKIKDIENEEKEKLSEEIALINERVDNNDLTPENAEQLKREAAEKHALNIENRSAIIANKQELLKRNGALQGDDDFSFVIDFDDRNSSSHTHSKRTYSNTVIAIGLNNAIIEGQSLDDSPYRVGGSRFFELGHAWTTRVLKDAGWLRVKYGFSFQFNGLKPEGNNSFIKEGNSAVLQENEIDLDKSKLRLDNLVIPLHFEFGPSKRKEKDGSVSFNTHNQFKIGLGGYAGLNLNAVQKLKFEENGEKVKVKNKLNSSTNNLIYGLSGYIGWDNVSLYAKYDLNPIFKNGPEQRNASLGLRFDFD
jgi:hypothetical protein